GGGRMERDGSAQRAQRRRAQRVCGVRRAALHAPAAEHPSRRRRGAAACARRGRAGPPQADTPRGADRPGRAGERSEGDRLLPQTRLQPHTRHFFEAELRSTGRATHLRVNVYPDGGLARLRAFGEADVDDPRAAQVSRLNGLSRADAVAALRHFCGSLRWTERMADARPFEDAAALLRMADRAFWSLSEADWMEAFAAHPRIGAHGSDRAAQAEQAGVQQADRADLQRLNDEYFGRHGFVFLV